MRYFLKLLNIQQSETIHNFLFYWNKFANFFKDVSGVLYVNIIQNLMLEFQFSISNFIKAEIVFDI